MDYKVDAKKLKQVFKLAGRIVTVDLSVDKDGNSRGFAVIEYDHPVEAVQAISMLDRQILFERRMTVRLDRIPDKNEGIKLPEGLKSIGIGLGPNGEPLRDVARNLPNSQQNNGNNSGAPVPVAAPNNGGNSSVSAVTPGSLLGPVPNNNALSGLSSNLAALSNVVNFSSLSGALANPLLNSAGLSNLGLNLSQQDLQQNQNPISNSGGGGGGYNTGNSPFQSSYSNQTFNSNLGVGTNSGGNNSNRNNNNNDFDMGNNPVRSYNTQPQDDFGNRGGNNQGGGGGGGLNNSFNNLQKQQNQIQNNRKSDTIVIKNVSRKKLGWKREINGFILNCSCPRPAPGKR